MTESNHPSEDDGQDIAETGPTQARIRRTPWRGWLMAVPLAALILVAYLVIRTWLLTGPTVTVTFPSSEGIGPQGTAVKYKGLEVGSVAGVSFIDGLSRIQAKLDMNSSVADAINSGTKFWIVTPSIMSGDVSSLLSGAYIAMRPGGGAPTDHFEGTLGPPPQPPDEPGTTVTLTAPDKGSLAYGSAVTYHGLNAGRVLEVSYDADDDNVRIRVFVKAPFNRHLGQKTRFWRAGGFGIMTGSNGIDIQTPGLQSLLKGAVAFAEFKAAPDLQQTGPQKNSQREYPLYASRSSAHNALAGPNASFSLNPPNSLQGLANGAPVTLQGVKIGRVTETSVHYDPGGHDIAASATVAIYAVPLGIKTDKATDDAAASVRVRHAINDLVGHGLRARLASANLIFGGEKVVLAMTGQTDKDGLDEALDPPGIPMVASSNISAIIASVGQIANKLNTVPIDDIGRDLAHAAANARALSGSPEIKQALANLNHSLANVEAVTARANGEVEPTLKSLRSAAQAAESAARKINQMTGGPGGNQNNIGTLVVELTRAARSIRVLTDYLQAHPEALLRGRNH